MRWLLIVLSFAAMPLWAQSPDRADFARMIAQAWPQADLRKDQLGWMAQASQLAHQQCRSGGYTSSYCDEVVVLALQEQLEQVPRQAVLHSVQRWVE